MIADAVHNLLLLFGRTDSVGLCTCRYPGEVIPGLLYLGNWEHAENFAALKDLGVTRYSFAHTTQPCFGLLWLSFWPAHCHGA